MRFRYLATILALLASSGGARAQAKSPPESKNAALRYWAAIAEMNKLPYEADVATQKALYETLNGQASTNHRDAKTAKTLRYNEFAEKSRREGGVTKWAGPAGGGNLRVYWA